MVGLTAEWKKASPDGVLEAEKLEEAVIHLDIGKARTVLNRDECKVKPEVD